MSSSTKVLLCLSLFIVTASCNDVLTNAWLDYIVTVEKPVTFVTFSDAVRTNGSCCSPMDPSDCTVCPDDPTVEFKLYVCFRRGFARGYNEDAGYCPLGGVNFTPNTAPGPWDHLTAHPEASSLPVTYAGSVQLYVQITAVDSNGVETHVDDVWVYGERIPPDGVFRRITYLSFKHIAIVGVNTRVECVNGAVPPNCTQPSSPLPVPNPPPPPTTDPTTIPTTSAHDTTPPQTTIATPPSPATTAPATTTQKHENCSSHNVPNSPIEPQRISMKVCTGVGFAAGGGTTLLLSLVMCAFFCCICKNSARKSFRTQIKEANADEEERISLHQNNRAFANDEDMQQNSAYKSAGPGAGVMLPQSSELEATGYQNRTFLEEEVQKARSHTLVTQSEQPVYEEITCVHIP